MRHFDIFEKARSALIRAHAIERGAPIAIAIGGAMTTMAVILTRLRGKRSVFVHQLIQGWSVRMVCKLNFSEVEIKVLGLSWMHPVLHFSVSASRLRRWLSARALTKAETESQTDIPS